MEKASQLSIYDWAVGYLLNKYEETAYILSIAPSRWDWSEDIQEFYDLMQDAIEKRRWKSKNEYRKKSTTTLL